MVYCGASTSFVLNFTLLEACLIHRSGRVIWRGSLVETMTDLVDCVLGGLKGPPAG